MSEEHCTTCEDREEITSGKMQLDFNGFYIFLLVTAASENKERKKKHKNLVVCSTLYLFCS